MTLTIGVEEEYQTVDAVTGELVSVPPLLKSASLVLPDRVSGEILQPAIEVNTQICNSIDDVRQELGMRTGMLKEIAAKKQIALLRAGTHPTAHWQDQEVTDHPR